MVNEEKKRAYRLSERGREKQREANKRYQQSDAYKEYKRLYYIRKKAEKAAQAKL